MAAQISGRTWPAIIESDKVDFDGIYTAAVLLLAANHANEHLDELEAADTEIPADLRPVYEDPEEILHLVREGQAPPWWPAVMGRLAVKITVRPNGETPEPLSAQPIDPNQPDLGCTNFTNVLKTQLESAGSPFEGQIQIKITRLQDKATLGGWRGEVYVGEKAKKKKGGNDESEKDAMFDLMLTQFERNNDAMHRMFGNASNVIHASASALNALRGANAPPPWMRGEEGEMPMWMMLGQQAMQMVMQSGVLTNQGQANPGQTAMNMMQHPVQNPGALGGYGQRQISQQGDGQPQLPGPSQDLGYNQYMNESGDYDGVHAHDDDLIDDGFEDDEDDDPYADDDAYLYEDEDDDEDEDDELEYEEPPRNRVSGRRGSRSGNPLDGMTPDEIQDALSEYIDKNQDKKAQLKQMGMGLAGKLLG